MPSLRRIGHARQAVRRVSSGHQFGIWVATLCGVPEPFLAEPMLGGLLVQPIGMAADEHAPRNYAPGKLSRRNRREHGKSRRPVTLGLDLVRRSFRHVVSASWLQN